MKNEFLYVSSRDFLKFSLELYSKVYDFDVDIEFKWALLNRFFSVEIWRDNYRGEAPKNKFRIKGMDSRYIDYYLEENIAILNTFNYQNYQYEPTIFKGFDVEIKKIIETVDFVNKAETGEIDLHLFKRDNYETAKSILENDLDLLFKINKEELHNQILKSLKYYEEKAEKDTEINSINKKVKNGDIDLNPSKVECTKFKSHSTFDKENLYVYHYFCIYEIDSRKDLGTIIVKEELGKILDLVGKEVKCKNCNYNIEDILNYLKGDK